MNAQLYQDMDIQPIIIPFDKKFEPDFVFIDNNIRPHRMIIINLVFKIQGITELQWPHIHQTAITHSKTNLHS